MPGGRQQRYAVQDRVFAALERLESKETQHAAFEELQRLIRELDASNLSTLIHAAGTTTTKTTQFARVHSLRLVSMCTQQACCPAGWRAMLVPPLLSKLLGLFSRALHDADSAVRGAAAEGFGVVAAQLAAAHPGGSELTAGTPGNPLLACILDALSEPGGAVQAAAASALAAAADYLCPGLDPALLHQLLRALGNLLCLGRAELCAAIARLEDGRIRGLLASSCQQLLASMPELMGSQQEGTGLLGVLTVKGKDFQARAAAAHTLKALAVGLGPLWAGGWEAALTALRTAKTDISKPVRDAALAALPIMSGLVDFMAAGAPAEAWPQACGSLLAGAEGGRSKRLPGSGGSKPKAAATGRPVGPDDLANVQHIPAVWQQPAAASAAGPLAVPAPPLAAAPGAYAYMPAVPPPAAAMLPLIAGAPPPTGVGAFCPPPAYPQPAAAGAAGYAGGPGMLAPASALAVGAGCDANSQLTAQLAAIQDQQARMAATLSAFTSSTQGTLHQLQKHLATVSAGVAALSTASTSTSAASSSQHVQQGLLQDSLTSVNASMAALAVGVDRGAQQMQQQLHSVGGWALQALAGTGGRATQHAQPPPKANQQAGSSPSQPKRLSSLHRSFDALQQLHQQHHPGSPSSPSTACASPGPTSASPGSPAVVPSATDSPASQTNTTCPSGSSAYEHTYAQLLNEEGPSLVGDQQAQLRILRTMAKSGPVWEQLTPGTGHRLMGAITGLLQEGIALKRLLPWLWPLADTATPGAAMAAAFPAALKQQLLTALAAYPLTAAAACTNSSADRQQGCAGPAGKGSSGEAASGSLGEKRDLLLSALRAVWD